MNKTFEETIGGGPFTYVSNFTIPTLSLFINEAAYNRAMETLPTNLQNSVGVCAHCGRNLLNVYIVRNSRGDHFGVGSACINKSDMSQVEKQRVKHEGKSSLREANETKLLLMKSEIERLLEDHKEYLHKLPHPNAFYARRDMTYYDYFRSYFREYRNKGDISRLYAAVKLCVTYSDFKERAIRSED